MLLSKLLGKTLRQPPADADTVSHQLLLRAGMISQLAAGVYSLLPLGWRVTRKIEAIIREEMDAAGSQELLMPALQPLELWEQTGRAEAMGQTLFHLKDRRDREFVIAPTHEEVITLLVSQNVRSYRDLPQILYQIQTKFRDEPRPRGGLVRVREFTMKDAYSFDIDDAGLDESYHKMMQAYKNIYARCGVPALMVEADSGAIGGKDSHEFMLVADSGEDQIIRCSSCDYAANAEKAAFVKVPLPMEEPIPLEEVATPGVKTIRDLAAFLNIPEAKTLKAVFYWADGQVVFVNIRGNLEVNEVKLKNTLGAKELRLASPAEVESAGLVAGYASPVGLKGVKVVADESVRMGSNFVVGANKPDTHLRNANYPRDFQADIITDIALAQDGYQCARCQEKLTTARGIEIGHIFKLGTVYSEKLGARYLDQQGDSHPIIMGCYGIGVGRLVATAVEHNHDEKGITWPSSIAPFQVQLVALNVHEPQVAETAERVYKELQTLGIDVLYDDRDESPGVKFNDADLIGCPLRLTISPRTLGQSSVEIKRRTERESRLVPLDDLYSELRELLNPAPSP
ncbi:MAG: prolyl-tRNA synthetase [Dehalococcoidia bacterium]|nr:prolyl-tRNA synthetase [Dehalococcoidia bacterium]